MASRSVSGSARPAAGRSRTGQITRPSRSWPARARLTNVDGTSVELTAGDVLTLPKGWSGRWDILETVRKLYVIAG